MKPIGNRVLIKPEVIKEQKVDGIIVTTAHTPKPQIQTGFVIGIGRKVNRDEVTIGNKVLFDRYASTSQQVIMGNGEEWFLVREPDILGVLT